MRIAKELQIRIVRVRMSSRTPVDIDYSNVHTGLQNDPCSSAQPRASP